MEIEWTKIAQEDFDEIMRSAAGFGSATKRKLASTVEKAIGQIATFPRSARIGRSDETRELVLRGFPYVLVYRVTSERLTILTIRSSARRWPASFPNT